MPIGSGGGTHVQGDWRKFVNTPNDNRKPLAWFVAGGKAALVLAALGIFGCSSGETRAEASADPGVKPQEEEPVVLTQAEETELVATIDESKKLLDNNSPQQSLTLLERSVELNPSSFAAHNNLCVAYGMMSLRDKAVAECQLALEITPDSQLAKNNLNWVSGIQPAPVTE